MIPLGYPQMTHTVSCPRCNTQLRIADGQWVACPNTGCDVELQVYLVGHLREKEGRAQPRAVALPDTPSVVQVTKAKKRGKTA